MGYIGDYDERLSVLDHGYVRLVDKMGDDLRVVNAARVSFDKESAVWSERDARLVNYLARHGHMSPFRHVMATFEIYAPLMVARQWWKYVVGSDHTMDAWNESSRRYVTEGCVFYLPGPGEWRSAPESKKQGSGPALPEELGESLTEALRDYQLAGLHLYEQAIAKGVAVEQARLFLPAYGLYVRWYWTGSLQSICHLINQRVAHDAQFEIQQYAKTVLQLIEQEFPHVVAALVGDERV